MTSTPGLAAGDCDLWIDPATLGCLDEPVSGEPPAAAVGAVAAASKILWALSGRVWGPSCPVIVRPCRRSDCDVPFRASAYASTAWAAAGVSRFATAPARPWPCGSPSADLDLQPLGPVHDVLAVTIDGAPFLDWRLDEGRLLRRTDGYRWPSVQNLNLDLSESGTWGVTYRVGRPLDSAALRAVEVYACELYKARLGDAACRLPRRTRQVVRQSVTIDLIDPMEYLDAGRTGIPEIDAWIRAVNPYGLAQPSRAINVDRRPPRVAGAGPVVGP